MPRLPPAEKLPLATRKNIRDEFDAKKPEFEKTLSDLMGVPWAIDISPNAIFPYAKEGWALSSLGSCIASYVDSAIGRLKYFESIHGKAGLAEINGICGTHELGMDVDESQTFSYCGCTVSEGRLVIVFNEGSLGTNSNDALDQRTLLDALNAAPPAAGSTSNISYAARAGIRTEYDSKIEEVRASIADMIGRRDGFKLSPNFDDVFARLAEEKKRKSDSLDAEWESRLGYYAFSYFEGLAYIMKSQGFGDDDLLREGFNEGVEKAEVALRIVDKLQYDSYCEVVIEDGVLYIQMLATTWGTNAGYAAQKLIDQL